MPHLQHGEQLLPFGGRSPRARHASLSGARVAVVHGASQASRMLLRYLSEGPQTDLELHAALGLPESRISARRSGLMAKGYVRWSSDVIGPHKAINGKYELTYCGISVAKSIKRSE